MFSSVKITSINVGGHHATCGGPERKESVEEGKYCSHHCLEDLLALAFIYHCTLGTLDSGCDSQVRSLGFANLPLEHSIL